MKSREVVSSLKIRVSAVGGSFFNPCARPFVPFDQTDIDRGQSASNCQASGKHNFHHILEKIRSIHEKGIDRWQQSQAGWPTSH